MDFPEPAFSSTEVAVSTMDDDNNKKTQLGSCAFRVAKQAKLRDESERESEIQWGPVVACLELHFIPRQQLTLVACASLATRGYLSGRPSTLGSSFRSSVLVQQSAGRILSRFNGLHDRAFESVCAMQPAAGILQPRSS